MTFALTAFYYLAGASVASAILAVTRKNPVHSMLWVLALFLHVAGIFLLLDAEFLAAVQVIVYAGAILIFYLFVLMLLDLPGEERRPRFGKHWPLAAAAGLSFAAMGLWVGGSVGPLVDGSVGSDYMHGPTDPQTHGPEIGGSVGSDYTHGPTDPQTHKPTDPQTHGPTDPQTHGPGINASDDPPLGSLSNIGMALFGPFALPFEMASLVLLAAIVGAVVLARRRAAGS